jgi:hypothetical protein
MRLDLGRGVIKGGRWHAIIEGTGKERVWRMVQVSIYLQGIR